MPGMGGLVGMRSVVIKLNLLVVIPQVNKCFEFGDVLLGMINWSRILLFPQKLLGGLLLKLM